MADHRTTSIRDLIEANTDAYATSTRASEVALMTPDSEVAEALLEVAELSLRRAQMRLGEIRQLLDSADAAPQVPPLPDAAEQPEEADDAWMRGGPVTPDAEDERIAAIVSPQEEPPDGGFFSARRRKDKD